MKLKLTAMIAAWIIIASTCAFAQTGFKISGKVTGNDGKPLDGATIYLSRATDSVLVKTALAEPDGSYILAGLKAGNYKLAVNMIGFARYKTAVISLDKDMVLPAIALQQKGTALKEVSVSASRPLVEHKIDRTVVNVDADISNAGSTVMEMLEKAPGVVVDQNGGISLNGKGVRIFIDDKPTYLSGADLENYLRSLSSSTIDQLELMTNPPAKYDAAGNGGVINIRSKRSKVVGFNGSVNLSYSLGRYGRTNNSGNFNYRKDKLNITGNVSYNTNDNFTNLNINRMFTNSAGNINSIFIQNDFIRRWAKSYNARLSADYYLSDKTTIGIGITGLVNPQHRPTINTSNFYNPQYKLDSTIVANNNDDGQFDNAGLNLNYRHEYATKGQELTVDVDYLNYYTNNVQSFLNTSFLPNNTVKGSDLLTGNLPAHLDIYSAKTDYTQPLKNGIKLSTGLKTSYTTTDNMAGYFYTLGGVTKPDYGKTNHFLYRENINAAYLNASKDYKRFSLQAGLRLENTVSDGHQLGNAQKPDSSFRRNYTSLFPTVYLQYKLDSAGHHNLTLDYGRRIDRPYYQDLNPFQSPLDKFTYYVGNPFLRPSYTNNFELTYSYKNISLTASYGKTLDDVNETIEIVNGIYYSRPGNLGSTEVKTISVDAPVDLAKWFNLSLNSRVQNIHTISDFYTGRLNTQGTYFFGRMMLQFKPGKDWTIQTTGGYQSQLQSAQFTVARKYRVDAAIAKKLSTSTSVKLALNDIFYTWDNGGIINNLANTLANYHSVGDTRFAQLTFSYRFGKAIQGQRKHNANGADSEQNRVKN
ncbi:TonB-dependent receptor [Mucilaginibacter mali]|uniref:TonB-dependent receptor n=1 Tax=Mucilaginibacter mali TaxID=2740462 RepID=A0A7D4Q1G2_9SPHI|nr:TonB-dependent receptor [Mucilaginibacter mali]QKJ28887.1 TonB-dependent receptor [Mucilaginibacter mali]